MSFGKWLRRGVLLSTVLGALYVGSCRKSNGIENNTVIQTPYGLYFTDGEGALYNTNDGRTIKRDFPVDGSGMRSITISGPNVIFIKRNVHVSEDNAQHFNPKDTTANRHAPFQSIMLDVPSHGRVYICVDSFPNSQGMGIKYSEDHGLTWKVDTSTAFDTSVHPPYGPSSFAQTRNGDLFAYNNRSGELIKRTSKTAPWVLVRNGPDTTNKKHYFLSHFNNVLLAADTSGGVYYSSDAGQTFAAYPGLPGAHIVSLAAPFEQTLLAGTKGAGIYRLVSGSFVAANNGLAPNSIVYSIAGKDDTYKNGVIRQYIYIATNTGLYRSEDGGENWTLQYPGDMRRVF